MGALIAIEWPRYNRYWEEDVVQNFIGEMGLGFVTFDGCMFGLVSNKSKNIGMPIRKPWKVATNSPVLRRLLSVHCDGSHKHVGCQGADTKATEGYTDYLVACIHDAFHQQCAASAPQNRS